MTYLEIIKFYYEAGYTGPAPHYLRVKGKTVNGTHYVVDSVVPNLTTSTPAVPAITINMVSSTTADTTHNVYLGDIIAGTDKDLDITVKEGDAEETEKDNYKNSVEE